MIERAKLRSGEEESIATFSIPPTTRSMARHARLGGSSFVALDYGPTEGKVAR